MRALGFAGMALLAVGAFGCVNSSRAHDASQATTTQTSGAALNDDSAQARSESTRDNERVVVADTDHASRRAERTEGPTTGPDPLPWAPRAGAMPGPSERPSNSGTIRIANPYNSRNNR